MVQEAQLRDQEREVALKEAEEESRLQEQVFWLLQIIHMWKQTIEVPCKLQLCTKGGGGKAPK